jgi:hypothetical protein
MRLLDRILTGTGSGTVEEYIWFTPDDLVTLGIWNPPLYVEGRDRIQGDQRWTKQRGSRRKKRHKKQHT